MSGAFGVFNCRKQLPNRSRKGRLASCVFQQRVMNSFLFEVDQSTNQHLISKFARVMAFSLKLIKVLINI